MLNHQSLALDYYQRFIGYETEDYRGYYHRGQLYAQLGKLCRGYQRLLIWLFYTNPI
ncbi:MAG UNVERIFIED_CONTAM: hypothetical protein LVR29_07245 [Microcystis novacekii LVE1205-3]